MALTVASWPAVVERIGGAVDAVGAIERAAMLATRSIKRDSKLWALDLAVRCCDLTTLEGSDTPGKVRQLAAKARRPAPTDASIPSVATAFPSGQAPIDVRLEEVSWSVGQGADEVDVVISRNAFLAGDYGTV